MSDNVIAFPGKPVPTPSDELRRATLESIFKSTGPGRPESLSIADTFLAQLWVEGFKVVPVEADVATASVSICGMDVAIDPSVPEGMMLVKDQRAKSILIAMVFPNRDGAH